MTGSTVESKKLTLFRTVILKVGDINPLGPKMIQKGAKAHSRKVKIIVKHILFVYLLVAIGLHYYLSKGYK